ncbi:Ser Thr kinase [Cryptosporidium bovis]|uniref:Ser Thr kinase n=1 Tax=Cryptosporidium bovis TaxID=310047 RepID=UPI00351A973C|nr:Ser Thr kinase [Cryptosporidium bovis]
MPLKEKISTENFLSDGKSFSGDDYDDILSDYSENVDNFLSPLELSLSGTQENIECVYSNKNGVNLLSESVENLDDEGRTCEIFDFFINKSMFRSERYEYKIAKLLGYGYYGNVFLASRSSINSDIEDDNKLVAIKIIDFEKIKNNRNDTICSNIIIDVIDQISDEINILTALNGHENAICYYESFCIKPHYLAFVTEYISGYTLRDIYKSYGPFPESLICYVSESILKVLVALDESSYRYKRVHKDIKSTNIMINYENCKIKLLDFGVSQIIDTIVDNNTPKISSGTLQWMSPELIQHREYNNLTDIWSLGVTLLELSIGDVPKIHELFKNWNKGGHINVELGSTYNKNNSNDPKSLSVIDMYINMLLNDKDEDTKKKNLLIINKIRSFSKLYLDFLDKMLTIDLDKRWSCNQLINHKFTLKYKSKYAYVNFQSIEKELYYFNNKFDIRDIIRNNMIEKIYKSINYYVRAKLNQSLIYIPSIKDVEFKQDKRTDDLKKENYNN